MANTKQAIKRVKQNSLRQKRNQMVRSKMRTRVKSFLEFVKKTDLPSSHEDLQKEYKNTIRVLSKAATKGVLPKKRASRKISRLTKLIQKRLLTA